MQMSHGHNLEESDPDTARKRELQQRQYRGIIDPFHDDGIQLDVQTGMKRCVDTPDDPGGGMATTYPEKNILIDGIQRYIQRFQTGLFQLFCLSLQQKAIRGQPDRVDTDIPDAPDQR